MNTFDPLEGAWELPNKLREWGEKCSPPLKNPHLAQINFERTPIEVMSIGRLLLPDFIEFQGGVFLKSQFSEERFSEWIEKLRDISKVEKMMNHIHVYDVFGYAKNATEEEFLQVAILLQRSWTIALSTVFPNDHFDVTLRNSNKDYGPVVDFYRIVQEQPGSFDV